MCVMKTFGHKHALNVVNDSAAPVDAYIRRRAAGPTYTTRGRDVVMLGMLIIQVRVDHAKTTKSEFGGRVLWTLCAGFCLHYRYRYRYRYRSYFGLIVPKPFWFRYPTLA